MNPLTRRSASQPTTVPCSRASKECSSQVLCACPGGWQTRSRRLERSGSRSVRPRSRGSPRRLHGQRWESGAGKGGHAGPWNSGKGGAPAGMLRPLRSRRRPPPRDLPDGGRDDGYASFSRRASPPAPKLRTHRLIVYASHPRVNRYAKAARAHVNARRGPQASSAKRVRSRQSEAAQ